MTSLAGKVVSCQISAQCGGRHSSSGIFRESCPQLELTRLGFGVSFVCAAREGIQTRCSLGVAQLPERFEIRRQTIKHSPVLKRYQ